MQQNNLEPFLSTCRSDRLALGMVITLTDPVVSELAGDWGWDFTWIDLEHGPLTIKSALAHVMAVRGTSTAPLIRVPGNNPLVIKPLLELAPAGVIVPMVNDPDAAAAAVAACRYPPQGIRGCGPRRGTRFGRQPFGDYLNRSQAEPIVIVQIEHIDAVSRLDRILEVPGVDSICVGPCDLAASMGHLEDPEHPEVQQVIDDICARTRKAGKMLGSAVGNAPPTVNAWRRRGANWLAVASDWGCLAAISESILARENPSAALAEPP